MVDQLTMAKLHSVILKFLLGHPHASGMDICNAKSLENEDMCYVRPILDILRKFQAEIHPRSSGLLNPVILTILFNVHSFGKIKILLCFIFLFIMNIILKYMCLYESFFGTCNE